MVQVQVVRSSGALESYQTRRGKMRGDCTLRPIWGGVPSPFYVRNLGSRQSSNSHITLDDHKYVVHSLRRRLPLRLLVANVVDGAQQEVSGSGR